MKAAVVEELGHPPRYGEVEEPAPTSDLVVAEVRAAAVKNIERALVAGSHYGSGQLRLPGLIGLDAIVALPDGRRVYAGVTPPGGALAERMLVDPNLTVEVPDTVDDLSAAALPNAAKLSAQHAEHPFDLVLDYLWGHPAEETLRALANDDLAAEFHRTRYVQIGEMAGPTIELPAAALRSAGIELLGQGGGSVPREAFARVMSEILPALFRMLAEGSLTVDTETRPLSEVTEAWTAPTASGVRTVLTPQR